MIQGIHIQNYRALRDVKLGKLWQEQGEAPLTPLTVVIGKNGAGKSSLFDAFGFLSDCVKHGVEEACDMRGRGGFERLCSQGSDEPIKFEIYYRQAQNERPITYELHIGLNESGRPIVLHERLRQRRKKQTRGRPFSFLILNKGVGVAWRRGDGLSEDDRLDDNELLDTYSRSNEESNDTEWVELDDAARLAISTLGALQRHPRISQFRKFIENWYLSYFSPDAARSLPLSGSQKYLDKQGENLGNVVQYMQREYPNEFQKTLDKIARKIPGIRHIDTEVTQDRRLLLRFHAEGFEKPFYAQQMSDGTLKVFTYLLLLASPAPSPFICIEEPENGLYPKLLSSLAEELRHYAVNAKGGAQVFVTTHQPYFVNSLQPEEVWLLEKKEDGFSTIRRASADPLVVELVQQELPLGNLWISDYLDD